MIIPASIDAIQRVTFYKRDEITSDLICCDISTHDRSWTFHEEMTEWDELIDELNALPNFARDWFASVSQPPFELSQYVAFERNVV